jgi:hypothetical protein
MTFIADSVKEKCETKITDAPFLEAGFKEEKSRR